MLGRLNITSWGFCIGAIGQDWFYARLFPHISERIILAVLFVPWLTAFAITFFNRPPPIGLRAFRICLLGVVAGYTVLTILAEFFYFLRPIPPSGHISITAARMMMYAGLLAFVPFIRAYITLLHMEPAQFQAQTGKLTVK